MIDHLVNAGVGTFNFAADVVEEEPGTSQGTRAYQFHRWTGRPGTMIVNRTDGDIGKFVAGPR